MNFAEIIGTILVALFALLAACKAVEVMLDMVWAVRLGATSRLPSKESITTVVRLMSRN